MVISNNTLGGFPCALRAEVTYLHAQAPHPFQTLLQSSALRLRLCLFTVTEGLSGISLPGWKVTEKTISSDLWPLHASVHTRVNILSSNAHTQVGPTLVFKRLESGIGAYTIAG